MSIAQKLLQLTGMIYSSQTVLEILQAMIDAIASEITSADLVGFFIRENESMFRGKVTNVPGDRDFIQTLTIDLREDPFARQIAETKRPVFVSNVKKEATIDPVKQETLSIQSILGLPLLVDQHIYGMVFAHNVGKPMLLTQEQQSVAETFINVASIAIQNIEILKAQNLRNQFSNRMSECKSIKEVTKICSDYVKQVCDAHAIGIHLLDVATQRTTAVFVSPEARVTPTELNALYRAGFDHIERHSIFWEVIESRAWVFIPDTARDERVNSTLCKEFDIQSLLVLPLREKDTVVGLMTIPGIGASRAYRTDDIAILQSMADTTGVTLSNVIHSNELERLVLTRTEELRERNSQLKSSISYLEIQEARLRGLVNAMPLSIVLIDENGKWIEANHIAIQFFKLQNVHYRFKTGSELSALCGANREIIEHMMNRKHHVYDKNQPCIFTDEYKKSDGSILVYKTYLCPMIPQADQLQGIIYIGEDLTEQRRIEEVLYRSEKLALVGQLAAGVAHEIRNPLTSLSGFIQLLKEEGANPMYCDVMLRELERLNTITKEFLFLAKPAQPNRTYSDLNAILFDVILLFQAQTMLQQIELNVDAVRDVPLLFCDENQIKQVLINLLNNAIEALPSGGKVTLSTFFSSDDTHFVVRIKDNGSGISKDRLKRIGEPFYTTKEKGTGLGLMTCFKIMELHGGALDIKSDLDHGTVVDILLPLVKPSKEI
ncbi:GAF domain-containing protein [Ferroacidibacillus organovorans]|uniref:histidine kinase n=1 Tax=Ferroacidibacillus organovorans TaxID=1765683 RepID=A0A853KBS2_9BACL|nr:GAF domain-containing protein [Ferroacidibacillus organovorans]KYP82177.1 hypothetical protein AYJ22_00560 [Ferroacidibacillus organovorans]OAG93579.1 hypothetical protein AYW79_09825 [Ferroacidibacillus organovorans]